LFITLWVMKKIYALYFLIFFFSFRNDLPAAITYNFCAGSGTFTSISGTGTASTWNGFGPDDDMLFSGAPIGFTFNFNGAGRTTFDACTNGWMSFTTGQSCSAGNSLSGGSVLNGIAPLWDDLAINAAAPSGGFYQTSGSAPNRVLTVEWSNVSWRLTAASPYKCLSFQVKLYETTNVIEFIYSQGPTALSASPTASIGLCGASGDYYSLNNSGASPTPSKAAETTNIATKPATGQVYRWDPNGACTLPIELYSFSGKNTGEKNLLEWITATEMNNDYFTIEKSEDAISFTELTRIQGAGNSSTLLYYKTYDAEPFSGKTYYRLKQTDYDGKFTYSDIIVVNNFSEEIIYMSPNPVRNNLHLDFYREKASMMQFDIVNTMGQSVLSQNIQVSAGKNSTDIHLEALSKGIYTIIFNENNSYVHKQIKFLKL
jgi:hypothetical protein